MKQLLFILSILFALPAMAQNPIYIGGSGFNDSNVVRGKLRVVNRFYIPFYATPDSNKVLGVDASGAIVLRTKSNGTGSISGVWLFMPSAFNVTGQGNDSLTVSMPGTTGQYLRGNGTVATFPTAVSTFTNDAGYLAAETQDLDNVLTQGNTSTLGLSLLNGNIAIDNFGGSGPAMVISNGPVFSQLGPGLLFLSNNAGNFSAGFSANNITANRSIQAPDQNGTLLVEVTNTDVEITDNTKGVIMKSPNGTRWRVTIDNSGIPTYTSL